MLNLLVNLMIQAMRQQKILEVLHEKDIATLNFLSKLIGVSVMTIRRDVADLSARNLLTLVRGGVKSGSNKVTNPKQNDISDPIIISALEQISDSKIIFFDGGEKSLALAKAIPWEQRMTAVTNDMKIAIYIMSQTPAELFFVGGGLKRRDNTFHHSFALDMVKALSFELLILCPDSWNEQGVWHREEHRILWYETLFSSSRKSILLASPESYSSGELFKLYPIEKADFFVS